MKTMQILSPVLMGCLLLGAGCASLQSEPTTAEVAQSGDPVAMQQRGHSAVSEGTVQMNRGQERVDKGQQQVDEGQRRIDDAQIAIDRARSDYRSASIAVGSASSPGQIEREAATLKKIAKNWDNALDEIKSGQKLTKRGYAAIDRGNKELREGQALRDAGEALVRRGDELLRVAPVGQATGSYEPTDER